MKGTKRAYGTFIPFDIQRGILLRHLSICLFTDRRFVFQSEEVVEANGSFAGANTGGKIEKSGVERAIDGSRRLQSTSDKRFFPFFSFFLYLFRETITQIAALERSRKIDELQKRLVESEMLRTRYSRKLSMLKEQMRSTTETAEQERSISDHSLQLLRDELAQVKQNLSEVTKRESQVRSRSICRHMLRPLNSLANFSLVSSCKASECP